MDFFSVLALLGGLAIFLYGMNLMGDGLAKVAGGKLERILETLTSNPIRAVLLGMGVTAVIQSSSATTVMVVGFVNSGIMKLSQVVGTIMGANIGTTVTSWILSLTGIQSDNFIIRLFKQTSFSPILALIGVVLIMFTKSQKKKDVGAIFVGFAILMYGMNAMRETIGGIYQMNYWIYVGKLAIYLVVSLVIGLLIAIPFRKLNHVIEKSKENTEIMI